MYKGLHPDQNELTAGTWLPIATVRNLFRAVATSPTYDLTLKI